MTKPRHIYLIRHGQSIGNIDRSIHSTIPDWQIPLTDLGHEQAKKAGESLHQRV